MVQCKQAQGVQVGHVYIPGEGKQLCIVFIRQLLLLRCRFAPVSMTAAMPLP